MALAFTDYPLTELGDVAGQRAPIREVEPLSFDGNKYVRFRFEGQEFQIKAGYLYIDHGRLGEVATFDPSILPDTERSCS